MTRTSAKPPREIVDADRELKAYRKRVGPAAFIVERERLHEVFIATARRMHLPSTHLRVAKAVGRAEHKANLGMLTLVCAERISAQAAYEAHCANLKQIAA